MIEYTTVKTEVVNNVATVWLNRPQVRNAFNEVMINELIDVFTMLNNLKHIRVIILKGAGQSFCAGADLNWMKNVLNYSKEQNFNESLNLSKCFYTIYSCTKPTIAIVHGAAIGGANGLLAACDIVLADEQTVFSLSEVKIGIIPACISPYVIKRIGEFTARELMLTGTRFSGKQAESYRLVNHALPLASLHDYADKLVEQLLSSGPNAMQHCKNLLNEVCNEWTLKDAFLKTAEMIAEIRGSEEGQEGMNAFLEKRMPNWVINKTE